MTRALLAAVLLLSASAAAVTAQSEVRSEVDTTVVTVGDRITMTVLVDHPSGDVARLPDSLSLAPFEVLEVHELPAESTGEFTRSGWTLTLTAFELGELEIPSIPMEIDSEGSVEVLETDRYGVEVVSVGSDESGDIRAIRGPFGIRLSSWIVALWILVPILLAALLYALVRRLRPKGGETSRPALGPPPRPAHEIALEALDALAASPLLERGQIKEYHIAASDILRTYVESRYRVEALEMTTREVLEGLAAIGTDAQFRVGLRNLLEACDLVKFAKARPDESESRAVLELGRRIIRESVTTMIDQAPEPAGAGAEDA